MSHKTAPRIAIDARVVGPIPHGFSRYITRLTEGLMLLREQTGLPYQLLFLVSPQLQEYEDHPFKEVETVEIGAPFLNPIELLEIPVVLHKLGINLYHSPTFSSLYRSPCPWIATVHDLNHLIYGSWAQKLYYNSLLKSFALKSKALVTVSEFSRREIARWLGLSRESIDIVYNSMDFNYGLPLSEEEVSSVLQRYGLKPQHYFICLSNPKPHKNIPLLVEAYRSYYQSVAQGQALPLVLSMSEFADVPGVLSVGGVPDGDARVLVSASKAVVFPSLYEGFGLPPVEAASMGTSVIVSQIEPHQEGLSSLPPDEVTWVDPRDLKGWVKALGQAADDQLKPVSLGSRTQLLARFDVRRMAQDMDLIYRRVLGLNL